MDVLERAEFEVKTFGNPSKESGLKLIAEVTHLRQLLSEAEAPNPMDPYTRIVFFFDEDQTAGSFLREDGDGGFTGAIHRMAREIDRLRTALSEAEQRAKDARRVALEDAARYHEYRADNHAAAHKHVVSDLHEMMEKTHRNGADDIRALQSEER